MRWRSPREIAFRLTQEARNLGLLAKPPALPQAAAEPRAPLPDPEPAADALRGTPYAESTIALAEQILHHRFPLLGVEIETGPEIHWRRDYLSGKETAPIYFRKIPFLDPARAGDHKIIWELNRHQHLVLLAQAHLLTGSQDFVGEIEKQLDSWFAQNLPQLGINWASALEVAFRALSWMWVDHLAGAKMSGELRARLRESLYRHACHLEANLSVYYSPNTHLLGEAVALHALGRMFHGFPRASGWEDTGARIVAEEMDRQVRSDGSHFEQSSYYHVYALDMFLFHALLAKPSGGYRNKLAKMAEYLDALMGPSRSLPFFGDDDGGRFFHPYGPRDRFGRATLAVCGRWLERSEWIVEEDDLHPYTTWWMGPQAFHQPPRTQGTRSRVFADSGTVVMRAGDAQCVIDAGPFGAFRAGHSHADSLNLVARSGNQELLIDPGTYSYSDPHWRNAFRGTAMHNAVRVNRLDQADPSGAFGWRNLPQVTLRKWHSDDAKDFLDAECRSHGTRHRRRVLFVKPDLVFILDDIDGGPIDAEQFWHTGGPIEEIAPGCFEIARASTLLLALDGATADLSEGGEFGWRSAAYGCKQPSPVIACRRTGPSAVRFGAVLTFSAPRRTSALALESSEGSATLTLNGTWQTAVQFPTEGVPSVETD